MNNVEPMRELSKVLELEQTALELQALLRVLRYTDCDTVQAVRELPITLGIAERMAEDLYCTIADIAGTVQSAKVE